MPHGRIAALCAVLLVHVSLSSPQPLAPVACSGALALLAAAPSSSLVENCDFGNQQVVIASNSTVVLRSTVLGGVMFLGGVVVGNLSLTLANCSVVGLVNPLDPFLGSYSNALFTDVVISLQEGTVLRRDNASLQMGGGEGGILRLAVCNVTRSAISLSDSRLHVTDSTARAVFEFTLSQYELFEFCLNSSEIVVMSSTFGDLAVIRIDGINDFLHAINVSVLVSRSRVTMLSLGDTGGLLYAFVFHYVVTLVTRLRFQLQSSSFNFGSLQDVEHVPMWSALLESDANTHFGDEITIDNCSVNFRSSEAASLVNFGNSLQYSVVSIMRSSVAADIRGVVFDDSPSRIVSGVTAYECVATTFTFQHLSCDVRMLVGYSPAQQGPNTSFHYMYLHRVTILRVSEANDSSVAVDSCTLLVVPSSSEGVVELNTSKPNNVYVHIFLVDMNVPRSLTSPTHSKNTVVSIGFSHLSSTVVAADCKRSPSVMVATGLVVIGPSSSAFRISVVHSSVTLSQCAFVGASNVLRFATAATVSGNQLNAQMDNASLTFLDITLDTTLLVAEEVVVMSVMQLPIAMTSSRIEAASAQFHVPPPSRGGSGSTQVSLVFCGDLCSASATVITVADTAIETKSATVQASIITAANVLLPTIPSLLLSGCVITAENLTYAHSHTSEYYSAALLPSTVRQVDATAWTVRGSSFVGYRRLFNVTPPPSVTVRLEGCDNVWNGRPMRRSDVGAVRSAVSVVQGLEPAGGRHCERLAATVSVSKTAAVSLRVRGGSAVRVAASAASAVGRYAGLLASVSTVASGLAFLSQQASRIAACAAIADDGGDDGAEPPFSDVASNPLQLSFRSLGAGLASAGGCVVSSVVVAVVYFALRCCGVAAERRSKGLPWDAAAVLQLPGSLHGAMMLVLQPVVGAAVALVASPGRSAGSVVLGAIGVCAMCIVPGAYFCWNAIVPWRRRTMPLRIECVDVRRAATSGNCADGVLAERYEWRCALSAGHAYGASSRQVSGEYLGRFSEVLRPYRGGRQWYAAVEVAFGVLSGVVSGAVTALPVSTRCSAGAEIAATAAEGVLLCLAAVSVAVLRPYNAVVGNVLTVGSAAVALVSLVLASSAFGDTVNTVGNALTLAESTAPLIVVVLMMRERLLNFLQRDPLLKGGLPRPPKSNVVFHASLRPLKFFSSKHYVGGAFQGCAPADALKVIVEQICQSQRTAAGQRRET